MFTWTKIVLETTLIAAVDSLQKMRRRKVTMLMKISSLYKSTNINTKWKECNVELKESFNGNAGNVIEMSDFNNGPACMEVEKKAQWDDHQTYFFRIRICTPAYSCSFHYNGFIIQTLNGEVLYLKIKRSFEDPTKVLKPPKCTPGLQRTSYCSSCSCRRQCFEDDLKSSI